MATPDIMATDGSCIDIKTVKKRDGSLATFDTAKLAASISAAAISFGRNGKSMASLWQEMYQTMAIPSIHLGGVPYGQTTAMSAVQSQGRSFRKTNPKPGVGFSVSKEHPYEVSKNMDDDTNPMIWFDRYNSHQYTNRMEAEKSSLELLVKYYNKMYYNYVITPARFKRRQDTFTGYNNSLKAKSVKVLLDKHKDKLKNIEEEHPEWLI